MSPAAREALAARARRVSLIRRRVAAAILTTFVLAWGAIVWDGSMGAHATGASTASTTATGSATTSQSADSTGSSDTPSAVAQPGAVTTRQS
jgi:hypothetical protein